MRSVLHACYTCAIVPLVWKMAGMDNPAVAEAMRRAKELAMRMTGGGSGNSFPIDDSQRKRTADTDSDVPLAKKPGTGPGAPVDPKALAQSALAKMGIPPIMGQQSITLEIKIPDSLVGLVIGRGGESIQKMQSTAGAKIQVAPDGSAINGERIVTISGSPEKVEIARSLVEDVVDKNKEEVNPDNLGQLDAGNSDAMMILSSRVGLIIGKGGEMIKSLSERSGCKLQMIQDGPWLTAPEKPLKITGEKENRERAKEMVLALIASKEGGGTQSGSFGMSPGVPGGGGGLTEEFSVPAPKCGVIIGKGGETIRLLQQQSGAHIELSRAPPPTPDQRVFIIKGSPPQIESAKNLMNQKLDQPFPQKGNMGPSMGYPQQQPSAAYGMAYGGQGMFPQQGFGYPMPQQGAPWGAQPQQQPQQHPGGPQVSQQMQQHLSGGQQPPTSGAGAQVQQTPYDYNAWAAYYQNYYAQQQQLQQQQQPQQQQPQQPSGQNQSGNPNPQASQPSAQDLQAQWAEYYRQMGYTYPMPTQQQPQGQQPQSGADVKPPGISESQ